MIIKTSVEIDTNSSFSNPETFEVSGIADHIDITGLSAEISYYVRAYVVDDQGNRIDGENTMNFTTTAAGPNYFYIQNEYNGSNTITLKKIGNPNTGTTLEYSLDGNDWTTCTYDSSNNCDITLSNRNDKVYFRSSDGFNNTNGSGGFNFQGTSNHIVGGDLRTLLDYTNSSLDTAYIGCFKGAFENDTKLTSASNLDFSELPILSADCYYAMFLHCTGLSSPPELPATTLASGCYCYMFSECTNLTKGPILPATTLKIECYYGMFEDCPGFNRIITYAQNISANQCLRNWLNNVSLVGNFYNLGGATYPSGASGIPTGWTVHTSL